MSPPCIVITSVYSACHFSSTFLPQLIAFFRLTLKAQVSVRSASALPSDGLNAHPAIPFPGFPIVPLFLGKTTRRIASPTRAIRGGAAGAADHQHGAGVANIGRPAPARTGIPLSAAASSQKPIHAQGCGHGSCIRVAGQRSPADCGTTAAPFGPSTATDVPSIPLTFTVTSQPSGLGM